MANPPGAAPARAILLQEREADDWVPSLSTIYHHIDQSDIGIKYGQTPARPHMRKRKKCRPKRALKNPENVSIEERADISARQEFGRWEMDTVVSCVGGSGGLLVLLERSTRFAIASKLRRITQRAVWRELYGR